MDFRHIVRLTTNQTLHWTGLGHETPEVLALWARFDACCTYVKLDTLPESHEDFATFNAL